jgi:ABC-type branched-subunit amino acid transport system substrate-binding protein
MLWLPPRLSKSRCLLRGLCTLTLVGLLLVACSLPGHEVPVLKIGLVAPFEGSFRESGYDAIYAARLAVRELNASGGARAWRLELVAYDDRGSTEMAAQAARNLVADTGVIAVIGHYRSETTEAAASIYGEAGLPFITVGGWGSPAGTTWHLMPARERLIGAMLAFGSGETDDPPVVWGTSLDVAMLQHLPDTSDDHDSADTEPSLVLSLLPPIPAAERMLAWRGQGSTAKVVGDLNLAASAFGILAGADAVGTAFVTPYPFPKHVANTGDWISQYQGVGPHVPAPGVYALPTYEAVYVVAEALAATSGGQTFWRPLANQLVVTREDMTLALGEVDRSGWLGRIAWDAQHCWREAPLYGYEWTAGGPELVERIRVDLEPVP